MHFIYSILLLCVPQIVLAASISRNKISEILKNDQISEILAWTNANPLYTKSQSFLRNNLKLDDSPPKNNLVVSLPGEMMEIDLTCAKEVPKDLCEKARVGFISAGRRLTRLFKLNTVIKVKANFRSFCLGKHDCELTGVLGQASPTTYIGAKVTKDEEWSSYPQALVKQMSKSKDVRYTEFDINADFNSDFNYWFMGDKLPMGEKQIDFEFVIAHEFVHGLGFDTLWTLWNQIFPYAKSGYVSTSIDATGATTESATANSWLPQSIFDKYVTETVSKHRLTDTAKNIFAFKFDKAPLPYVVKNFESSNLPFTAAKYVYDLCTSGANVLSFQNPLSTTQSNLDLFLYTTQLNYASGSAIAHVASETYLKTEEFLMVPAVSSLSGNTLDELIANNGGTEVLGPKIIAVLVLMGYPAAGGTGETKNLILMKPSDKVVSSLVDNIPKSSGCRGRVMGGLVALGLMLL